MHTHAHTYTHIHTHIQNGFEWIPARENIDTSKHCATVFQKVLLTAACRSTCDVEALRHIRRKMKATCTTFSQVGKYEKMEVRI